MTTPDDGTSIHFDDGVSPGETVENHESVGGQRSWVTIAALGMCIAGLAVSVILDGSKSTTNGQSEGTPPAGTSTTVSRTTAATTEASTVESGPFADPLLSGELADGTPFTVTEPDPGVLCAVIDDVETCHLELVTASGPAIVSEALVFGYLSPGTASAAVRYRFTQPSNSGIRVDANARFFAVPLRAPSPYRLQYLDADFAVDSEVPLVAWRGGSSQSPEAAFRDDVPAEIAALAFTRRVTVGAEWSAFAEGPMVWSRPPAGLSNQPLWSEVLRLDTTGTVIERSTPLPGIVLTAQLARSDALYFLGQQLAAPAQPALESDDAQLPTVVIRLDRATGEHLVRLFPQSMVTAAPAIRPSIAWPGWVLGPELDSIDPTRLGAVDDLIQIELLDGGTTRLDPDSLLPVD